MYCTSGGLSRTCEGNLISPFPLPLAFPLAPPWMCLKPFCSQQPTYFFFWFLPWQPLLYTMLSIPFPPSLAFHFYFLLSLFPTFPFFLPLLVPPLHWSWNTDISWGHTAFKEADIASFMGFPPPLASNVFFHVWYFYKNLGLPQACRKIPPISHGANCVDFLIQFRIRTIYL